MFVLILAMSSALPSRSASVVGKAGELGEGQSQPGEDSSQTRVLRFLNPSISNLNISGYYRFYGIYRNMARPTPELANTPRRLQVGDGYREPLLNLAVSGNPRANTSFSTELFLFSPYSGAGYDNQNPVSLYLGVNLNASVTTANGIFNVKAGGTQWYSLSPLTLWQNRGYNRFSLFDRTPWEAVQPASERYLSYYKQGALNQDERWEKQAFQGIVLEGIKLPHGFEAYFIAGKTQNNGGTFAYLNSVPNVTMGGRLLKRGGWGLIGVNQLTSRSQIDATARSARQYQVLTASYQFNLPYGIRFSGESGLGKYASPGQNRNWDGAYQVKLELPRQITGLPIELQAYSIGPNFINLNGTFFNTSASDLRPGSGSNIQGALNPFSSPLTEIGQFTNNRRGLSLNTEFNLGKLKVNLGAATAGEVVRLNNQITYYHRVNGLQWSRFALFQSNTGPYQRVNSIFRTVYETVNLKDSARAPLKQFNTIEVHAKYSQALGKQMLHLFLLGSCNSVQSSFQAMPLLTQNAYLRLYTTELDAQMELTPRVSVIGYAGLERAIANYITDTDSQSRAPRNQTGTGLGLGADVELAPGMGMFVRHRWFAFADRNFEKDTFRGQETTLEIKLFF